MADEVILLAKTEAEVAATVTPEPVGTVTVETPEVKPEPVKKVMTYMVKVPNDIGLAMNRTDANVNAVADKIKTKIKYFGLKFDNISLLIKDNSFFKLYGPEHPLNECIYAISELNKEIEVYPLWLSPGPWAEETDGYIPPDLEPEGDLPLDPEPISHDTATEVSRRVSRAIKAVGENIQQGLALSSNANGLRDFGKSVERAATSLQSGLWMIAVAIISVGLLLVVR